MLRREQATIATGAATGDLSLVDTIIDQHVREPEPPRRAKRGAVEAALGAAASHRDEQCTLFLK